MSRGDIGRDERTIAVENAGYRWSYLFLSYGLLVLVAYRSFARGEAAWDLLALTVLGGVCNVTYQAARHTLQPQSRWMVATIVTLIVAGVLAAVIVSVRR